MQTTLSPIVFCQEINLSMSFLILRTLNGTQDRPAFPQPHVFRVRLQQFPPRCVTRAWDFCPIFRRILLLCTIFIYVIIEQKFPLSEFPLPYLSISLNCLPPRMTGLDCANMAIYTIFHTVLILVLTVFTDIIVVVLSRGAGIVFPLVPLTGSHQHTVRITTEYRTWVVWFSSSPVSITPPISCKV